MSAAPEPKLTVEKFADGGIACLRLGGTIDESFDGKQLGASVAGEILVIDLGNVKKISSFGIREWVDFVGTASKHVGALYLIECAPKVVDQLNMVANFAGGGRVYSFYAPFRCDFCDSEHRVLLQVDRDHAAIRAMKLAERPCPSCKEAMYFDDDGATFFSYLAGQEKFELPSEVARFLSARLDYAVSELDRKLRIDKVIDGRTTYLRLAGNLDRSFPRDKLAEGLEGQVILDLAAIGRIEPAGAAEWRGFVQLATPAVEALYLAAVPPSVLEKLASREDLGPKGQVVTLTLPYSCKTCGLTTAQLVDVAEHHAILKFATAPELRCTQCNVAMQCVASEHLMTLLPALPRPTASAELVKSIGKLRERAMTAVKRPSQPIAPLVAPVASARPSWLVPFLATLLAIVLVASGYLLYQRLTRTETSPDAIADRSAPTPPAWISTTPCTATPQGLSCVGTAEGLRREDAEEEAAEAAYDELALALASRIDDPAWRAVVPPIYEATRAAKLAALSRAPDSTTARREVREARQAVVRALRAAQVPSTPSDRYWEQRGTGDAKRFVAHAQLAIGKSELATLIAQYRRTDLALGAQVTTAFPLVAWRHPRVERGALVLALETGPLKDVGLVPGSIVLSIGGRDIADAAAFTTIAADEYATLATRGGALRLKVQTTDATPREFVKEIAAAPKPAEKDRPRVETGPRVPTGGVNVWDRVGGNRGSGAP